MYEPANNSLASGNVALNPDGSQIALISSGFSDAGGSLFIYDGNFNLLHTQPLYNIDTPGSAIYSLDGRTLYALFEEPGSGGTGVALDTQTFSPLGLFALSNQLGTTAAVPLAVDETQMIFGRGMGNGPEVSGLAFTDASHPGALKLDTALEPSGYPKSGNCPENIGYIQPGIPLQFVPILAFPYVVCDSSAKTSSPTSTGLQGSGFDQNEQYNVYIGAPPASPLAVPATGATVVSPFELDFTIPSSTIPGPRNLTLTRSDGWSQVIPDAISYGPTILAIDPTAVSGAGQTPVNIYGYGLLTATVTIGGKQAAIISSGPYQNNVDGLYPLDVLQVTAPAGSPGPADVIVTTSTGSATSSGGLQYLASAQVYPMSGALSSICYDQPRQRLYVSNSDHNRAEIFDLNSQTYLSPVPVGNSPTFLTLTPDGTELAVLNSTDDTVSVIDPAQMKVNSTYAAYTSQDQANCTSNFPSANGLATILPHRAAVVGACGPMPIHIMNLDSGSLSCAGITGCDSTGTHLNSIPVVEAAASTPDGSEVFLTSGLNQVAILDVLRNTLTTGLGLKSQGPNAAANSDGNVFASTLGIYNPNGVPMNLVSEIGYLSVLNEGELGGGEAFNPSGSLLYMPSTGVDIFDVHRGRLALRVALPEQLYSLRNSTIAVDESGSKIFIISRSGITIVQLSNVPLSIGAVNPASGIAGTTVTIRGSGFESATTLSFAGTAVPVTFVDTLTLKATVPSVPTGPVRLTVKNPDGHQYSLDAAFTLN